MTMMRGGGAVVTVAAVTFAVFAGACRAEPAQVGILEQPQCAESHAERARVMFVEADGGWRAIDSDSRLPLPKVEGLSWTIGLNSKSLGRVTLKDPNPGAPRLTDDSFARDKLYRPFGKIPQIANTAQAFEGWCEPPEVRPLVIVSKPHVVDPEGWKPVEAGDEYRRLLYQPLRLVLGRTQVMRCTDAAGSKSEPFAFREGDLLPGKAYRSKSGDTLVAVALNPEKNGCDGPSGEEWNWWIPVITPATAKPSSFSGKAAITGMVMCWSLTICGRKPATCGATTEKLITACRKRRNEWRHGGNLGPRLVQLRLYHADTTAVPGLYF
jgi:hypothetical protein